MPCAAGSGQYVSVRSVKRNVPADFDRLLPEAYEKPPFVSAPKSHLELSEAFREFDGDGDGSVDFTQFACLVGSLRAPMTHAQILESFRQIDRDCDGEIEFSEFLVWWRLTRMN